MARQLRIGGYSLALAACAQGYEGWRASLTLFADDPDVVCYVRFVDDPQAWTERQRVDEYGSSAVFLPAARFQEFHHVLQSERPLFLSLAGAPANTVLVYSGSEPVGEQEAG